MELNEAIQKAIKDNGIDNVKEHFYAALLDYQAFEDNKLAKIVLSQVDKKGYMPQIVDAYIHNDDFQINAIKTSIINDFAFDKQVVSKIFSEFNTAFGLKTSQKFNDSPHPSLYKLLGDDIIVIHYFQIVNIDKNGVDDRQYYKYADDINYLAPKIDVVSKFNYTMTIDFTIRITNAENEYTYVSYTPIKSGRTNDLLLSGYSNSGKIFCPGKWRFELILDGEVIATREITIYETKPTPTPMPPPTIDEQSESSSPVSLSQEVYNQTRQQNKSQYDKSLSITTKIFFSVISLLYAVFSYFVGWGWLFVSIPLTIYFLIILFNTKKEMEIFAFVSLTAIMITILTPLPWWTILMAISGVAIGSNYLTD